MAPGLVRASLLAVCTGLLAGCVLPEFDKVSASGAGGDSGSSVRSLPDDEACGLSNRLAEPCDRCIRENCCDQAAECGEGTACGEDLLEKITPVADFSGDFDKLLGCMQRRCDVECEVNWGCVGDYEWPEPEGRVDVPITIVDFASEPDMPIPIAGATVKACDAVDALCRTGKRAQGESDASGSLVLPDLSAAFTGFYTFEGGESPAGDAYLPNTVQWSEPVHRVGGFIQYQLTAEAVAGLAYITQVHETPDEPFDPARGHLIVRIQGCLPMRYLNAPGAPTAEADHVRISFEPDEGATRLFYTARMGGVAVALEETTTDGVGGAFNVRPTNVEVTAVDTRTERVVATGNVQISAGGIGFMYLVARSSQ